MKRIQSGILALLVGGLLGAGIVLGLMGEAAAELGSKYYTFSYVCEFVTSGKSYDKFTGFIYNISVSDGVVINKFDIEDVGFKLTAKNMKEEYRPEFRIINYFGWSGSASLVVEQYYDYHSDAWYKPLNAGKPTEVSQNTWASDTDLFVTDFIVDKDRDCFRFLINTTGTTWEVKEANAVNLYSFRCTFDNGDYYEGYEYDYRLLFNNPLKSPGKKSGEGGQALYKRITKTERGFPVDLRGNMFFTKYYDAESRTSYINTQIIKADPKNNTSDYAYILERKPEFRFGYCYENPPIFYEADVSSAYDFRYSYTNGDYYTGTVYAPAGRYYLGYSLEKLNTDGLKGYYTIQKITPGLDASKNGQVFVHSYYDVETNSFYAPKRKGQVVGSNYLGSETDYIITASNEAHRFGRYSVYLGGPVAFHDEADATCRRFYFQYNFASGDYYGGWLYAPVDKYYRGYVQKFGDEHGETGYYSIWNLTTGVSPSLSGQVFVTHYYNKENNKSFVPLNYTKPMGTTFLGSEAGYIIDSAQAACRFGRTMKINPVTKIPYPVIAEADDPAAPATVAPSTDPSRLFYFYYIYANGDFYSGRVYAPKGKYTPGYTLAMTDEHGREGTYRIYQWGAYAPADKDGQVFVDGYYDRESKKGYTPLKKNTAVGTNYLGSESDTIITSGPSAFRFGYDPTTGKILEADVYFAFTYRRSYAGQDYYYGKVYAAADTYFIGQGLAYTDENGITGYYTITGASSEYGYTNLTRKGQVYVDNYYDAENQASYKIINQDKPLGTGHLKSETGYIIQDAVPEYKFGGAAEADVVVKYSFVFWYGTPDIRRDWYQGYVYAPAGKYMTGTGPTVTDEHGYAGQYYITGRVTIAPASLGRVEVTRYFNSESQKYYVPLHSGALGGSYLGSETDFIISSTSPHRFGRYAGVFYEAEE